MVSRTPSAATSLAGDRLPADFWLRLGNDPEDTGIDFLYVTNTSDIFLVNFLGSSAGHLRQADPFAVTGQRDDACNGQLHHSRLAAVAFSQGL